MAPFVPESAIEAVSDTLRTQWIGQGPRVEEFEREFAKEVSNRPTVAVGSCTDALHLSYILAGIGPGDEVIAPLFTCTATNIPLLYLGAKIRFSDVGEYSLNSDGITVANMIDGKTRAVVVVHYGGAPVRNIDHLRNVCRERGVVLIEDCAQALGGSYYGNPLGTFGDFSCFSFQAVKHITTGDGGMLVLKHVFLHEARRRRWFGIDREAKLKGTWANDITEVGYKYQMTDIGASMGLAGLRELGAQMVHRRTLCEIYYNNLPLGVQLLDISSESACWLLTVLVDRRADLQRKLLDHGIESGQVHYRNDRYTIFSESRGTFPNMDSLDGKYLVLPLHMRMSQEDVHRVCSVIKSGW